MIFLCENCGRTIDVDKDLSYTLIDNRTGKKKVICWSCEAILFGKRKAVDQLLREVEKQHFRNRHGKQEK